MQTLRSTQTVAMAGLQPTYARNVLRSSTLQTYGCSPSLLHHEITPTLKICAIASEEREIIVQETVVHEAPSPPKTESRLLRKQQRLKEQATYQFAAIAATSGVGSLAVGATYFRFFYHLHRGEPFPYDQLGATLLLVFGGIVGMEMYARWAHKHVWHDMAPGWALHKSHHEPRIGAFEANDIFAVMNAVPAFALCLYGFLRPDVIGGLCFGAGLGITLFGISYMFVHDGLVHKRFPVGPIADLPALKRIEVAHRIHHMDKYGGVPFGLFLGPQELEAVGGGEELDKLVEEAEKMRAKAAAS